MVEKKKDKTGTAQAWNGANPELQQALIGGWIELATEQAETNYHVMQALVEQSRKHWELTWASVGAYLDLFYAPASNPHVQPRASSDGRGLPIEDYDQLTVEEVTRRLGELSAEEVKQLRAYEKNNKNRLTLMERFERSLV
jgi:hypothetical protein